MNDNRRFDGRTFFREIRLFNQLQTRPDEQSWLTRPPKQPHPARVVLYLGCNVLRTGHLVRTVTDIFRLLGVDHVAVGGAAYCCGIVYHRTGEHEIRNRMADTTLRQFAAFQPERVVMWCPSCIIFYDEIYRADVRYPIQHCAEFLLEHLDRFTFVRPVEARVALHRHVGFPAREREAAAVATLLRAIPGVELLDPGADPAMDYQCRSAGGPAKRAEWEGLARQQLDRAQQLGAETFATLYHGCQRLLCGYERWYPFAVEHYLTVFGQALGIEHEDCFKRYLLSGDPEAVLGELAPCMHAHGIAEDEARALVTKHFTRELAL